MKCVSVVNRMLANCSAAVIRKHVNAMKSVHAETAAQSQIAVNLGRGAFVCGCP